MTLSIRNYLYISLFLSITVATTFNAISNYFLGTSDVELHLDTQLAQAAQLFQILITDKIAVHNKGALQKQLDSAPKSLEKFFQQTNQYASQSIYADKLQFQIWDEKDKLVLHSHNAPLERISEFHAGFSKHTLDGTPWRTFTLYDPKAHYVIVTMEAINYDGLAYNIAMDNLLSLLWTYPLLVLVIWVSIRKGMRTLQRVMDAVADRAPNHLEPVDLDHIPEELRPLLMELNSLLSRLRQAFDREKRFASDAAHELRTPLAVLKTQVQLAMNNTKDQAVITTLEKVLKNVDRNSHVIQQLLNLSRLNPDTSLEPPVLVNLAKLARELLAELASVALSKNIEVELHSSEPDPELMGHPAALGILIRNLVDNAIRYSPPASTVQVNISETEDTVTLEVIDNGPGIPVELKKRVFERFFRMLGTKATGSGLGLAIVRQIVVLHEATINLETPESGTGLAALVVFPKELGSEPSGHIG